MKNEDQGIKPRDGIYFFFEDSGLKLNIVYNRNLFREREISVSDSRD